MADRERIIRVNRLLLIVALAQLPLGGIVAAYIMITSQSLNELTLLIVAQATILVPTLIYLLCFKEKDKNIIPVKGISIATIPIVILLSFMIWPLIGLVNLVSMLFTTNEISGTMDAVNHMSLGVKLFAIALLPAIGEELLFRGLLYGSYKKKGVYKALLLSALLFGLLHMNLNQFLYATILGIFLVLLLETTGSIIAPMIAHFVFNGTSTVINHFSPSTGQVDYTTEAIVESIASVIPIAVIATAIAVALFRFLAKQYNTLEHLKGIFRNKYATPNSYTNPTTRPDMNSAITFRSGNTSEYRHDDITTYLNGEPYYGDEEIGNQSFLYIKPFHSKDYNQNEYSNNSENCKMNGHTYNNKGLSQASAPIASSYTSGQMQGVPPMRQQVRGKSASISSVYKTNRKEKKGNSLFTPCLIIFILFCLFMIAISQVGSFI